MKIEEGRAVTEKKTKLMPSGLIFYV